MFRALSTAALFSIHVAADMSSMIDSLESSEDSSLTLLQTKASRIEKHDPAHWGYGDVSSWSVENPDCAGSGQSPVDLPFSEYDNRNQDTLDAMYLPVPAAGLRLENNGHALQVNGAFGKLALPDGIYNVLQFHFHCPSEHSVDGVLSSCEMHIVHQKEGSSGTNDLAVIGILFDSLKSAGATQSSGLELSFLRQLGFGTALPKDGDSISLKTDIDLRSTFNEVLAGGYFHYKGSLTTPPCSETVHWYVMRKKAAISQKMVDQFKILFPNPSDNRPVQPLNGRAVAVDESEVVGEFAEAEAGHAHWTYSRPDNWAVDNPDCAGQSQSPIDIAVIMDSAGNVDSLLPKFDNLPVTSDLVIVNNGHAVQVNGNFGVLNLPDGAYDVLQFHVHMPSEHTVNGQKYDGEMHIVTQKQGATGTNSLAVIALLLQGSKVKDISANSLSVEAALEISFFRRLGFKNLPLSGEQAVFSGGVDLVSTFAAQLGGRYWHYTGSLTTPPCSQTVHWYVMQTPAHLSMKMISNFKELFPAPMDNRPVQDLNGRSIVDSVLSAYEDEFSY